MNKPPVDYNSYLKIEELLTCQQLLSNKTDQPAHDDKEAHHDPRRDNAAKRIENMWITTQAQADALAGKMVRLYHNPTYLVDANILNPYISFDNNLGKVVDIYSQFDDEELPFILLNSRWEFNGDNVFLLFV